MSVDLRKNKEALIKAFNEVCNVESKTNWAIFGYEGVTPVLKCVSQGEDGIEEMVDDLNSGKILYAYCRVKDPNTGLAKFVLINWQGEGVPENVKFKCANHMPDVSRFFHGAHVTINARTDDDVEEDVILEKVSKASGARYGVHKEKAQVIPEAGPVGSVYKRTRADSDIKTARRDQFWEKTEKEEQHRKADEQQKAMEERAKLERERKEREAREETERNRKINEHMKQVTEIRKMERAASLSEEDKEKKRWEEEEKQAYYEGEQRRARSESLRKQKAAEAAMMVSQRENDPKALFKQREAAAPASLEKTAVPPRKLRHGFGETSAPGAKPPRKAPIELPTEPAREPSPEPVREPSPEPVREPSPEPVREPSPEPVPVRSPVAQTTESLPATRNLLAQGLPPRQDSDDEQEDEQNWDEPSEEDFHVPEPTVPSSGLQQDEELTPEQRVRVNSHIERDESDVGLSARALYDYQAEDDTEITFDPDDIITNIEQIDPGWWRGVAPDGSYGLFPANYVELI